jgi:putative oxidoreductase
MNMLTERVRTAPAPPAPQAVQPRVSAGDVGLLFIRITIGLLLAGHACQKLFGLFGGPGLGATAKSFAGLGYHPGTVYAVIGGASELAGGLGLVVGLLTPLASAAIIGVMINAMVTVAAAHGLWAQGGGLEYNIVLAVVALGIALTGPGRLAADRIFPWGRGGWKSGACALVVGGVTAAVVLNL